ncbi:MAG: CBS domain-containing protein [Bacteroidales bacterium]|nr:CBS domain-containing protein [Bacteroidales bacterium]
MITVNELLNRKGHDFWYVSPNDTVLDALQVLAEKDIGAAMVIDNGKLVGMFSERDYARKLVLHKLTSKESKVRDIMSKDLVVVNPDTRIYDCMALMTKRRVRHLPVMQDNKVAGLISIGDVVNEVINDQKITINDLEKYILGTGYGADI